MHQLNAKKTKKNLKSWHKSCIIIIDGVYLLY